MRRTEATRVDPVSPVFLCRSGLPPDTAVRGTSRNQDVQCFSEGERRQVQPDLGQDDLSGPHTDAVDAGQVYAGPAVQLRARVVVPVNAALRRSWRESMAPGANEKSFVTRLTHCCRPADSGRPFPPQRVLPAFGHRRP